MNKISEETKAVIRLSVISLSFILGFAASAVSYQITMNAWWALLIGTAVIGVFLFPIALPLLFEDYRKFAYQINLAKINAPAGKGIKMLSKLIVLPFTVILFSARLLKR